MEKTKINSAEVAQEKFMINDAAVGKSFTVRDATDQQLAKALQSAQEGYMVLMQQFNQLMNQLQVANSSACVFSYEIERRAKSIKIAH